MIQRIYFDNAATAPLDPRVAEAMATYLHGCHGNPSSLHEEGRLAREAVERARRQVARLVNADASEMVFTASGTEADNMALEGVAFAAGLARTHIITSAIEHPAIMACCRYLEHLGVGLTVLPVSATGLVDPAHLENALRPETRLVSIMAANNVIGTLEPIDELARIARQHGALFHTDAVQMAGRLRMDVQKAPIDLVSISAHKLHGPKGVGALYIRRGVNLAPLIHGGGQEEGRRSGTENVAGIVGFGVAAELAVENMAEETARLVNLRDQLIDSILEAIPNAYLVGERFRRLPGHVCLGFAGMEGEAIKLLLALDEAGIAVASGSACSSHHAGEPSHVLTALGFDPLRARGSLRITLGRFNTREEVERFVEILPSAVQSMRSIAKRAFQSLPSHRQRLSTG
jgi:cysteine desulfurase